MPAPILTSVSPGASVPPCYSNSGSLVNCSAGISVVWVNGRFLYPPLTATVGGVDCAVIRATEDSAAFGLPLAAFDVMRPYDLVVSNPSGSAVYSSALTFNSLPTIPWVASCRDPPSDKWGLRFLDLGCETGDRLILRTSNVLVDMLSSIALISRASMDPQGNLQCGDIQQINATAISCVVPQRWVNRSQYRTPVIIQLVFKNETKIGPLNFGDWQGNFLYDFPDAPRITQATGCATSDAATSDLQLDQCLGGDVITLTGRNFDAHNWTLSLGRTQGRCTGVVVLNATTLTCQLPLLDDGPSALNYDTPYILDMRTPEVSMMRSNAAFVTFVSYISQPTPDPSASPSSSSSSAAVAAVAAVVGVVVLVAALVLGVRLYRRQSRRGVVSEDEREKAAGLVSTAAAPSRQDGQDGHEGVELNAWGVVSSRVSHQRLSDA